MDLWLMIKERYALLSVFIVIILGSLFLLLAIRKIRSEIPKSLIIMVTVISSVIIVLSILALIFMLSFGYNA